MRIGFLAALLLVFAPPARAADAIDRAMLKAAEDKILPFLEGRKVRSVGVLKFLVGEAGGKPSDSGELNRKVADRLELALALRTDIKNPIGVTRDASAVAARLKGADHSTAAGREPLFAAEFPLAWGGKTARLDALLAGQVRLRPDRSMSVTVVAYLPGEEKSIRVAQVEVAPDLASLLESGNSFATRDVFGGGKPERTGEALKRREAEVRDEAAKSAAKSRSDRDSHPAFSPRKPPVEVKILYDGKEQAVEFRDGEALVAEPQEGQRVEFRLARLDEAIAGPLAVVLKVNGENTIERETKRDPDCRAWLLRPGEAATVKGFLRPDNNRSEEFKVMSRGESEARAFDYGSDVGTISWSVFREASAAPRPKTPDEEDDDALNRGLAPTAKPKTLRELREMLREAAGDAGGTRTRGLIGEDKAKEIDTPTRVIVFRPDPAPILRVTVRYYKKKSD